MSKTHIGRNSYLQKAHYFKVSMEHARIIASVISENMKVPAPGDFRFMERPLHRNVVMTKRPLTNEVIHLHHIVVDEPLSSRLAVYEMVSSEANGSILRYRGRRDRAFTHFGIMEFIPTESFFSEVAMFHILLEDIKNRYLF